MRPEEEGSRAERDDVPILGTPRARKWGAILFGVWFVTSAAAQWVGASLGGVAIMVALPVVGCFALMAVLEAAGGKADFSDMWRAAVLAWTLQFLAGLAFGPFTLFRAVGSFLFVYLLSGAGFFLGSVYLRFR